MTDTPATIVSAADALNAVMLCGVIGLVAQGARAAVGLKDAKLLDPATPTAQSGFNLAYFGVSMMIGFVAGVIAGFVAGLGNFNHVNLSEPKLLLGIGAAAYGGADFIENSLSLFKPPKSTPNPAPAPKATETLALVQPLAPAVVAPSVSPAKISAALGVVLDRVNAGIWVPALSAAFERYDVDTPRRAAAAIGQFAVEAGAAFQELVENTNYTSAERLHEVFPKQFPSVESAEPYVGKPEQIANRAYAGRLGNGDEASGDGFRFRGRGLIQITGRDAYTEFGSTLGKTAEEAAAYCATPDGAAMSGCWFLASRGCLPLADVWNLTALTYKVNSAGLGAAQRASYASAMLKQLGGF
jgi:predicted chitinase